MQTITNHYIDGAFVESHGTEVMDIIKPTTGQVIARVTLADEEDTRERHRRSQKRLRQFRPLNQGRAHKDRPLSRASRCLAVTVGARRDQQYDG